MNCRCQDSTKSPDTPTNCPANGQRSKVVREITLKALLRGAALERRSESLHRFCSTSSCPVVYFGDGETFSRDDIIVPVFQKETDPSRTVCYCFDVSEVDIREEVARTGRSSASGRIRALVEADRCACEVKNPQGSCCLGNIAATERAAEEEQDASRDTTRVGAVL